MSGDARDMTDLDAVNHSRLTRARRALRCSAEMPTSLVCATLRGGPPPRSADQKRLADQKPPADRGPTVRRAATERGRHRQQNSASSSLLSISGASSCTAHSYTTKVTAAAGAALMTLGASPLYSPDKPSLARMCRSVL